MKKIQQIPYTVEKVVEKVTEMKNEVVEDNSSAYDLLLGKKVLVFCMNYNYTGILSEVNTDTIGLSKAQLVFETGPFNSADWKYSEKLPCDVHYICKISIESICAIHEAL
jgi:hypothetical protein